MSDLPASTSSLGATQPAPVAFAQFPIDPSLLAALHDMGFTSATPVQQQVLNPALTGCDVLVQSQTGSGKTCAYGVPLLHRLLQSQGEHRLPRGLILLPTRELAHQVATTLRQLVPSQHLRIVAVYGGVPIGRQIGVLKGGVDVLVGTPGRLLDHIRRGTMDLNGIETVVLDEADEMLSMGFWDDVTTLLKLCPAQRMTWLFSATLPYEIAQSAASLLRNPIRIDISGANLTVDGIDNQIYHVKPDIPKPRQLLYLLESLGVTHGLIFCNTRNETEMLAQFLLQQGFAIEAFSGNVKQQERERLMARIKSGELHLMVATDIAARGIDIADLRYVLNYALPEFSEIYLHRVGRTGRNGKAGTAISLVDGKGLATYSQLERTFGITFTEIQLPSEEVVVLARSRRMMKELAEKASVAEITQHLPIAQEIVGHEHNVQMIAYLLKHYFHHQAEQARHPSGHERDGQGRSRLDKSGRHRVGGRKGPAHGAEADGPGHDEGGDEGQQRRRRRRRAPGMGYGSGVEHPDLGGMIVVDAAEWVEGATLPPQAASASGQAPLQPTNDGQAEMATPSAVADHLTRIRVNIGFEDGFRGRGAVAKKIASLAGLNEGILQEVEARRDFAILKATPEIADLVLERVDGAPLGKKVIAVRVES